MKTLKIVNIPKYFCVYNNWEIILINLLSFIVVDSYSFGMHANTKYSFYEPFKSFSFSADLGNEGWSKEIDYIYFANKNNKPNSKHSANFYFENAK